MTRGHAPRPPYRLPSMADVAAVPWNGYTVASTFSGCGGSSLGYALAGFRVGWACEFVPAALDTYRANFPTTPIDARDIRAIPAADVLAALGCRVGELDVLDGSPPCASFSTAGKRQQHWGRVKPYSDTKQRTDDLFDEYTRLVRELQPRVFVAENVAGLVKGVAKGMFLRILAGLRGCGYRVDARVCDAQWLGVPQMRARLIFVGVRDDLHRAPAHPRPLPYRYSVRDALPDLRAVSCLLPGKRGGMQSADRPCPAVTTGDTGGNGRHVVEVSTHKGTQSLDEPAPSILTHGRLHTHSELGLVEVETDISRYAIGAEWDRLAVGEQSSKYRNLIRSDPDKPAQTLVTPVPLGGMGTISHPYEKRRFSIAELKRICAFPDDFVLTGTYAQQWERLGRAVPPLMMAAVATAIRDGVLNAPPETTR